MFQNEFIISQKSECLKCLGSSTELPMLALDHRRFKLLDLSRM